MRFTVTFEGGVFKFLVETLDADDSFVEEFELVDVNEAREQALELLDEISDYDPTDDADFVRDLFDEES